MKIINVIQGSPEWKAGRSKTHNASDYPSAQGLSKKFSRSALVAEKATGIEREFSPFVEKILENGHRVEALARPMAEKIIGEELYPIVATTDDGYLGASSDGVTELFDTGFECKQWNAELAEVVSSGVVPETHVGQLDQQGEVFGLERILFMVTDGTPEKCVYCWYVPSEEAKARIRPTWQQFDSDVEAYKPTEVAPEVVGHAPEQLPALHIEVTGMVTASNLAEFKARALAVIHGVNTSLQTDDDFADAEKAVKWCKDVEERLDSAKQHALSQTATIDALFRTVDAIKEEARTVRLKLEKLVKSEKENRKVEIVTKAREEFCVHWAGLCRRIGGEWVPPVPVAYFAEAIKGLKSLESMRSRLSDALANAKIEASQSADRIEANHKAVTDMSLFPDFAAVCTKSSEDFAALMALRVAQKEARLEAEREKIRAEELAKIEVERARLSTAAAISQATESSRVETEKAPVDLVAKKAGRLSSSEIRLSINWKLDQLNDHQLLNVLAYIEGHFIAHAA